MERLAAVRLLRTIYETDGLEQQVEKEKQARLVYVTLHSVSREEWDNAGHGGRKPRLRADLFAPDYHDEEDLVLRGQPYAIYRTYLREDETVELYCEAKAGVFYGEN